MKLTWAFEKSTCHEKQKKWEACSRSMALQVQCTPESPGVRVATQIITQEALPPELLTGTGPLKFTPDELPSDSNAAGPGSRLRTTGLHLKILKRLSHQMQTLSTRLKQKDNRQLQQI